MFVRLTLAVFLVTTALALPASARPGCRSDIISVETALRFAEMQSGRSEGMPLDRLDITGAREMLSLAKEALARGNELDCELHVTQAMKRAGLTYGRTGTP